MTHQGWPDLPALLAEIAEVAGIDAAIAIADEKGGQEVFISARLRPDNWLIRCIGADKAEILSRHFCASGGGRVKLQIPLGPVGSYVAERQRRQRVMAEAVERGASSNEIAKLAGITGRSVRRFRARYGGDPDQGSLF